MRFVLLFIMCFFIAQPVLAENTPPVVIKGDFEGLKHTMTGRVDTIIDQQTLLLKDGKIVRLLGLEYPEGESRYLGKSLLERLLPEGTEVMLYQRRTQISGDKTGKISRMGHVLAHLVKKENEEWINGVVVGSGLAYAITDADNPAMAVQLYALEQKARANGYILWAKDSMHGLLSPDTAAQGEGTFRVVEGVVNRAATSKNNLYLNFGTDSKKDFTVMVSPALRKAIVRKGIDPMTLANTKIRVRGWIRPWNGPFMELETAERLEVLSTTPSPELSTTGQSNP